MRLGLAIALVAGTLVIGACQQKKDQFSYNLTQNGCPTGEHKFSSKDEYCSALRDESLNNFCALDLRRAQYRADCGGDF